MRGAPVDLVKATEDAITAAQHLTPMDGAAVEALRALARKIQAWDRIVEFALEDAAENGGRPTVPQNDNVSLSAYMKCCEQLGLTPSGRKALDLKEARAGGKLASVRALKPVPAVDKATKAAPVRVRAATSVHKASAPANPSKLARVRSDSVRGRGSGG